MKTLNITISGTGFAGDFTARAMRLLPHRNGVDVRLAGITSGHLGNAERFAARHGVDAAFSSHREMLHAIKPDVDCIACANHVHGAYVIEAAQAGVRVIVLEKPPVIWPGYRAGRDATAMERFTESMATLDEVLVAVEEAGAKLLYAENFVYVDPVRAFTEVMRTAHAVDQGRILFSSGVCAHQGSHAPAYDTPSKSGGGALFNKACHPLGAALYLKQVEGILRGGAPVRPVQVSGFARQVLKQQPEAAGRHFRVMQNVDDFGRISVVFEDGSVAELLGHDLSISGIRNAFHVIADFGEYTMRLNPNDENELFLPDATAAQGLLMREKLPTAAGTSYPRPRQLQSHGYVNEMDDAVVCALEADRWPQSGAMLAWDTVAVLMGAYASSEAGSALLDLAPHTLGRTFTRDTWPDVTRLAAVLPDA